MQASDSVEAHAARFLKTRSPRPLINKPPPLHGEYNRDPNVEALERRGSFNHGSALVFGWLLLSFQVCLGPQPVCRP